jgi:hypothetical protein
VARLQEELPGQELVSVPGGADDAAAGSAVDLPSVEAPDAELITSGKGVSSQ